MILKEISQILDKLGYPYSAFPTHPPLDGQRLLVVLGNDSKNREYLLSISPIEVKSSMETLSHINGELPLRVEFRSLLPFKTEDAAITEVAHLLHFINPYLDLPGFELKEIDNEIFFRYVWITDHQMQNQDEIISIIGSCFLTLTLFSDLIEVVASGQKRFNEVLVAITETVEETLN